ncbi:MAG: hypothetical protein M3157_04570 [Actinomycetota bacterium]|nr:hypothetical protein [Actinomycetota bacterium]
MTQEEIARFALQLGEATRVRKMVAEKAALAARRDEVQEVSRLAKEPSTVPAMAA